MSLDQLKQFVAGTFHPTDVKSTRWQSECNSIEPA